MTLLPSLIQENKVMIDTVLHFIHARILFENWMEVFIASLDKESREKVPVKTTFQETFSLPSGISAVSETLGVVDIP